MAPARFAAALNEQHIDEDLVIPDKNDLRKGAIAPWAKSSSPYYVQITDRIKSSTSSRLKNQVERPAEEDAKRASARPRRRRDQVLL